MRGKRRRASRCSNSFGISPPDPESGKKLLKIPPRTFTALQTSRNPFLAAAPEHAVNQRFVYVA